MTLAVARRGVLVGFHNGELGFKSHASVTFLIIFQLIITYILLKIHYFHYRVTILRIPNYEFSKN